MVQFPLPVVIRAAKQLKYIFIRVEDPATQLIQDITRYAAKARRNGLLSLDAELETIEDPFFRKALMLAVDGARAPDLRKTMELRDGQGGRRRVHAAEGL